MTDKHALGDGQLEEQYRAKMVKIVRALDELFNDGARGKDRHTGFILMVFPFGEGGRCNYMSNGADRKDVVAMMKEQIARFEGRAHPKGHA